MLLRPSRHHTPRGEGSSTAVAVVLTTIVAVWGNLATRGSATIVVSTTAAVP